VAKQGSPNAREAHPRASSSVTHSIRDRRLLWFFALAYALSWALWLPTLVASLGWIAPVPSRHLHFAGGLGPMLAAMIVMSLAEGRPGLARLAKRCATGGVWMLIAILIPAGLFFLATAIITVLSGAPIEWAHIFITSPVAAQLPNVMGALLTVGTLLLIPVFGSQNLSRRPRVIEPGSA
jgi:hypothetical protein